MIQTKHNDIREFARQYTAAWCSRDADRVAAFFSPDGTLRDNDGPVLIGRKAIAESAQGFITAFPDLRLFLDDVVDTNGTITYTWTLVGTHSITGRHVRIEGSEIWRMGEDGLIAESAGSFDEADFHTQVGQ